MSAASAILSVLSGTLVGLSLGLIGGGGSILAVPLMVYVVGLPPHAAIGTSAVAVAVSALANLGGHARARTVKWPCALVFAIAGVGGAAIGAQLGKRVDGQALLAAFGVLMIIVAGLMLRPRRVGHDPQVRLTRSSAVHLLPPLAGTGLAVGALSGFFGIGGGFLIVPGLISATAMPLLNAIGSSLVSVSAFGATTAVSYAASGLVAWRIAGLFILGGLAGGYAGIEAAKALAGRKRMLAIVFSVVVAVVGLYVTARGIARLI
ncbi:MAG TPA: sulfite exporter TauE/SafE family protein [Steroidobacteraceae bacterium]|nr:sulfite exporter TauE/SafE family protein [Steroidobacteraceae bacterium]